MDAIQTFDPSSCLIQINAKLFCFPLTDLYVSRLAIGVVCLVVDNDDVAAISKLIQHTPRERLVTLLTLLHHRALLRLQRHQRMPVLDQDIHSIELLPHRVGWTQSERIVEIRRLARIQYPQALFDRESRRNNEHGFGKMLIASGVGQRVEHLPGDDHRHQRCFSGARGHLVA